MDTTIGVGTPWTVACSLRLPDAVCGKITSGAVKVPVAVAVTVTAPGIRSRVSRTTLPGGKPVPVTRLTAPGGASGGDATRVGGLPEPVSPTSCGPGVALSVNCSSAGRSPTACGANVRLTVQVACGATAAARQVFAVIW